MNFKEFLEEQVQWTDPKGDASALMGVARLAIPVDTYTRLAMIEEILQVLDGDGGKQEAKIIRKALKQVMKGK